MSRTLLIELYQPFAQYRNPFTFYYAQTYPLPPVSAVLGLFQRVLSRLWGWDEKEIYYFPKDEETARDFGVDPERVRAFWNVRLSIHGAYSGIFWNYQQLVKASEITVGFAERKVDFIVKNDDNLGKMGLPLYTGRLRAQRAPVKQQELFNGYLVILVRGDDIVLEGLYRVFKEEPPFVLRLGRSEDIVFPLDARFVESRKTFEKQYYVATLGVYLQKDALRMAYAPHYMSIRHWFERRGRQVPGMWAFSGKVERKAVFKTLAYVPAGILVKMDKIYKLEVFEVKHVPHVNNLFVPEVGWHGTAVDGS